jgi:hypothetical protein
MSRGKYNYVVNLVALLLILHSTIVWLPRVSPEILDQIMTALVYQWNEYAFLSVNCSTDKKNATEHECHVW